jgi:lipopolysaccharide export system protein LptC
VKAQSRFGSKSRSKSAISSSEKSHPALNALPLSEIGARSGGTLKHRRLIGLMKFVLPAVAVGMVIAVVVWPKFQPRVDRFRVGLSATENHIEQGPTMVRARYEGIDTKGQPFLITADEVENLDPAGDKMKLKTPQADITFDSGAWMSVTALNGIYDQKAEFIELRDEVTLFHDKGYNFVTSQADIDLRTKGASGKEPVVGQSPLWDLTSEGFRVVDGGRTIFFDGHATLMIRSDALSSQE